MTIASLIGWAIVATVLALKCRRPASVYILSSALAIILLTISQVQVGLLPMAGIVHCIVAGLYPLALFGIVRHFRRS